MWLYVLCILHLCGLFANVSEIVTMSQVECLGNGFSQFAACTFSTYSLHMTMTVCLFSTPNGAWGEWN